MDLTREQMLERSRARDPQSDGKFITGVLSTGIYCLPSCPARHPKPENVRFFPDEAGAHAAGLRACKRCRPDEFYRGTQVDEDRMLALDLRRRIDQEPAAFATAGDLAAAFEIGVTRLSQCTRRHFHESPAALLQHARIDSAAKALLTSERKQLDIALDVGFESTSAFHDNFKKRTGLTPGAFRATRDVSEFGMALPTDYRGTEMLAAWGRDPDSSSEKVIGNRFELAIVADGRPAQLALTLSGVDPVAKVHVNSAKRLTPNGVLAMHRIIQRLLGMRSDVDGFERQAAKSEVGRRLIANRRGLRMPNTTTTFEALVWAIVGQQINLPFAFALRRQLFNLLGEVAPGGLRCHPTATAIAALDHSDLTSRKFSRSKADYLVGAARAVADGELDLDSLGQGSATDTEARLLSLRGIGPWSSAYVMMRGLQLGDCVPVGDSALATALQQEFGLDDRPGPERTLELMAPFSPHRTLASYHFWRSLGDSP